MSKKYSWLLSLFLVVALSACSELERTPPPEPEPVAPTPEPEVKSPVEEPVVEKPKDENEEPDWKMRFAEIKEEYAKRFQPKKPGEAVRLKLKEGQRVIAGKLVSIDEKQVMVKVQAGNVGYPREVLSPESRALLYKDDYAQVQAVYRVKKEKALYDRKVKLAEAQERRKLEEEERKKLEGKVAAVKEAPPKFAHPIVNKGDGSVLQVKQYVRETTLNPESIKFIKWGKIKKTGENYQVTCIYSVQNKNLGVTTESKYFFMDKFGKVIKTAAFRGTAQK